MGPRQNGLRRLVLVVAPEPERLLAFFVASHRRPVQRPVVGHFELEFSEREGETAVVMTNSAIPTDGRLGSQERGWHTCYDNLDRLLAR
jgi:hypothetical protein